MAFSKRPTFLKRQKEQQRLARAARKREERLERKRAKALGLSRPDDQDENPEDMQPLDAPQHGIEPESEPEPDEEATD